MVSGKEYYYILHRLVVLHCSAFCLYDTPFIFSQKCYETFVATVEHFLLRIGIVKVSKSLFDDVTNSSSSGKLEAFRNFLASTTYLPNVDLEIVYRTRVPMMVSC